MKCLELAISGKGNRGRQQRRYQTLSPVTSIPNLNHSIPFLNATPQLPRSCSRGGREVRIEASMVDKAYVRGWTGIRDEGEQRTSKWAWAMVILCTVLAIGVILTGATVFAVYLIYKPKMPYLVVADAHLWRLEYDQGGTIEDLEVSITILARNSNSKADASFSRVDLAVGFHGADVARLRAKPFAVPRESSVPLPYSVVSQGRPLDAAGMRSMDTSLKSGVVPLDLFGRARTSWKVGIFVSLQFWTRISCRLHFFYPGNGTAMPIDRGRCTSKSP